MLSNFVPKPGGETSIHSFLKCILGLSDIAFQLSDLYEGLKSGRPPGVLTRYVRQMSVSLRSFLLESHGRVYTDVWNDGTFPVWPCPHTKLLSKTVVEASPYQEVHYTVKHTGEQRTLKVPGYKHGIVVNSLVGIDNSERDQFLILANEEMWKSARTLKLADWKRQRVFEVDGLVYDLETAIKTVSDKEGAHIDPVVDSDGIYTGTRTEKAQKYTGNDAYIRSRIVKFGPFYYPYVVVFIVSRYLVTAARESLIRYQREVRRITQQVTFASRLSTIRERIDTILHCPSIGRIDGLALQVIPERLVMRPPINVGMSSFSEEQAIANALPRYGETYVGAPRHTAAECARR